MPCYAPHFMEALKVVISELQTVVSLFIKRRCCLIVTAHCKSLVSGDFSVALVCSLIAYLFYIKHETQFSLASVVLTSLTKCKQVTKRHPLNGNTFIHMLKTHQMFKQ